MTPWEESIYEVARQRRLEIAAEGAWRARVGGSQRGGRQLARERTEPRDFARHLRVRPRTSLQLQTGYRSTFAIAAFVRRYGGTGPDRVVRGEPGGTQGPNETFALKVVVRTAAQRNVGDIRGAAVRERNQVVELDPARLRAPAVRAYERTATSIARPHFPLYMSRDVAIADARRLWTRARGLRNPSLFQMIHEQRQGAADNLGHIAIRDRVAHQILRQAESRVRISVERHA